MMRRHGQFRVNTNPVVGHWEPTHDLFGHVTADAPVTLIHRADFGVVRRTQAVTFAARPGVGRIILFGIAMGVVAGGTG